MESKLLDILMQPVEIEEVTNTIRGLPDNALIVEWGCGGSTQRWLNALKPGQRLVSIEHRREWYDKVNEALKDHPKRSQLHFYCIPVAGPAAEAYANFVEEFPGGADEYCWPTLKVEVGQEPLPNLMHAHMYFVDGICRGWIVDLINKQTRYLSNPITVYLHDYVGREPWYDWSVKQWPTILHPGGTLVKMRNSPPYCGE